MAAAAARSYQENRTEHYDNASVLVGTEYGSLKAYSTAPQTHYDDAAALQSNVRVSHGTVYESDALVTV
jgi:hypothetical protein